MKASNNAIELIKRFEGFSATPYLCPAGVPTIGYGSTMQPNDKPVTMKHPPIDAEEAAEWLEQDVGIIAAGLHMRTKSLNLNQNQFDALVCLAYNIGTAALSSSTLLKMLNSGDFEGAAAQFLRWNKNDGKVMLGLARRRLAEKYLFDGRDVDYCIARAQELN